MNHLGEVVRYLDALAFIKTERGAGWAWGRQPFVTISRQAGAGGHTLADAVLAELGRRTGPVCRDWLSFDDTIIRLLSDEPRHRTSLRALIDERYFSGVDDFLRQILIGSAPQDVLLWRIFHSLRALAGVGKAVILGRGGVCLTRDLAGGVHVRLVAGRESRVKTLRKRFFLSEAELKLDELERSRAALIFDHFRQDIEDPLLYDAVWNTDQVEPAKIAAWIVDRVEEKARALSAQESQRAASSA